MTPRWKVFTCQPDFPEKSIFCSTTCQAATHEQRHSATKTEHFLQPAWWAVCVMPPCCQGAGVPASVIVNSTTTPTQSNFKETSNQAAITNGIGLELKSKLKWLLLLSTLSEVKIVSHYCRNTGLVRKLLIKMQPWEVILSLIATFARYILQYGVSDITMLVWLL